MIIYILIVMLSISSSLLSMFIDIEFKKNQITPVLVPLDVIVHIISKPDIKQVYELIEKQKEINRSQLIYHPDNSSLAKSEQQPFFKIRQALFPCFALMRTCGTYYNPTLTQQVAHKSKEILYKIFPQGIVPFLLPNITHTCVLQNNFTKELNCINRWLECCFQHNRIDQNFIKTFLFFTPQLLAQVAQSPEFENLLKAQSLTHTYNDRLKQHTIYDASNTIAIVCQEEKHVKYFLTISPPFNITMPNIKKYQDLYNALIELCMKNIEVSSTINNIIYKTSDNKIASATLIEHIFSSLAYCINHVKKSHSYQGYINNPNWHYIVQGNLSHAELKALFGNFFTVLDVLCSLNATDLSLPAVSIKGNIAQKIMAEFKTNDYPFDIFSQQAQENIKLCIDDNSNENRFNEKKDVIDALVDIFLLHVTDQDKVVLSDSYKHHTNEKQQLFFQSIKNKFLMVAQIIAAFGIIYAGTRLYQ